VSTDRESIHSLIDPRCSSFEYECPIRVIHDRWMSIADFKSDRELVAFARAFFSNRVGSFRKDIAICMKRDAHGHHAYFPALITCIAFADLLSGLYAGKLQYHGPKELKRYAEKFMKAEYTSDTRRLDILYEFLRHKIAHLAYPYPRSRLIACASRSTSRASCRTR
jgi:hypothetical protein